MNNNFKYFEEMGDFINFDEDSPPIEDEINVDFCKCSECQGEFMLDEGETIERCPECGAVFNGQGDKT